MNRQTENRIVWAQTHQPQQTIRLPIGGQTVYVSRREAKELARIAQAGAILGDSVDALAGQLLAALAQMRSVSHNPLLAGAGQ